ncbi:MAG: hypothetical protein Q9173_004116 [Seirophora scorigena]
MAPDETLPPVDPNNASSPSPTPIKHSTKPLHYPSNPPPSAGRTTPSASGALTAVSTDPSLPAAQLQAAPSIRRPSLEIASTLGQTAPPFHQLTNVTTPFPPRATSGSNSSQKEKVRWLQSANTQPEHPARPRFAPVSSATLAEPEGIGGGRPNNGDQPSSLSAIAKIDQSLEVPKSLRKAQEQLRGFKPPGINSP